MQQKVLKIIWKSLCCFLVF